MPVIRRGDRDGIDFFVLKQLSNVHIRFRPRLAKILDVLQALVQTALVDVAQRRNLDVRNFCKTFNVILAASARSTNRNANTVISPQNLAAQRHRCGSNRDRFPRSFQEFATIDCHVLLLKKSASGQSGHFAAGCSGWWSCQSWSLPGRCWDWRIVDD